jgi:hypothetical protein
MPSIPSHCEYPCIWLARPALLACSASRPTLRSARTLSTASNTHQGSSGEPSAAAELVHRAHSRSGNGSFEPNVADSDWRSAPVFYPVGNTKDAASGREDSMVFNAYHAWYVQHRFLAA